MFGVLISIIKILLGLGLAGIFIVIGIIAAVSWLIRQIIVNVYYAIHTHKKKGGDEE